MVVVSSVMSDLGSEMPEFVLPDVSSGEEVSSEDYEDVKAILVIFISQNCPFVTHIADSLAELSNYYDGSGLQIIGISANDTDSYPEDSPEKLSDMIEEYDFNFPILYDKSQEVAKDFTAICTPDFFLYDTKMKLVYRGQFDDSRPDNKDKSTGHDLKQAIDAVLAGNVPHIDQKPSQGCSIKWKIGNEPTYLTS